MNPLLFQCPKTGRNIDVGIEINYGSLRNVQPVTIRLLCPLCDSPHEWHLSEGWIKEPPPAEAPQLTPWSACRDTDVL
jgi:hypothetical protein